LRGPAKVLHAAGHSFSDVARKVISIINLASVAALEERPALRSTRSGSAAVFKSPAGRPGRSSICSTRRSPSGRARG
jgi:hypothetical protein